MLRDFRFALRVLAAKPLFTLVAALSLGLGIGANSAIFSLVDTLWFRPLAVPDSANVVRLFSVTEQEPEGDFSYPEYLDFKRQANNLSDVAALGGRGLVLIEGDSHTLHGLNVVSSNFFTMLGVKPAIGRVFTPRDESENPGALLVVLGNSFWQRHYGSDPNIVGKQIQIERMGSHLATVIGVLPASFRDIERQSDRDLWFPRQAWSQIGSPVELETRGNRWLQLIGRLAPGASAQAANAQLQAIAQRMAADSPSTNRGLSAALVADFDHHMQQAGKTGLALLSIVLLVVMISSVNVANLLLSRAGIRGKEMAVRLALGASRGRIVRQLMAENILLGVAGLIAGLLLGDLLIAILPAVILQPPGFDVVSPDFQFDSRVLIFSLLVSLATVAFFGLAPALKSSRPDVVTALKGEPTRGVARRWRWPLRNWLVVAQIGVSMTLLACAGVLVRSFVSTRVDDIGFGRKQLLLVWLSADAKPPLYRDVISRFQGMPGVRSVAAAVRAPLSLSSNGMFQRVAFPNNPEFANVPPFEIKYNSVTANFLNTMGTPILRGRGFESRDEAPGASSVLINEFMARRFWPHDDPIGKTILVGGRQPKPHTVIGVVKNAPINNVGELPEPYVYLSYWANFEQEVTIMVETSGDATALAQPARHLLKTVDARLEPLTITTQNDLIRYSAQSYQMAAELVGTLGLLGLILTAVGLYGVVSYGVSQRTRELGIRMALGASQGDTLRLVLREVTTLGVVGMLVGIPLSLWATKMFSALLFGVGPWDIPAFIGAVAVLAVVLLAAGFFPARRATSVDPGSALRVT